MLDPILKAGATFDWITPLWSLLGPLFHGKVYTFCVAHDRWPGSAREITYSLKKRGIKTYAPMMVSGTLMFDVKASQAAWANHLLDTMGVPVLNPLPRKDRPKKKAARRTRRKPVAVQECAHCNTRYAQFRSKCKSCGAPM